MQRGFTKLFNTIVTSTIWQEDDKTRIVWITMLAIADASGIVGASIRKWQSSLTFRMFPSMRRGRRSSPCSNRMQIHARRTSRVDASRR